MDKKSIKVNEKMKKYYVRSLSILFLLSIIGCSNNRKNIDNIVAKVYENRLEINKLFKDVGIVRRDDKYILIVYTNNDDSAYMTAFSGFNPKKFIELELVYPPIKMDKEKALRSFFKLRNDISINDFLLKYTFDLILKMNEFEIIGIDHFHQKQGIATEYFISSQDKILYVPDPEHITVAQFKMQVEKSKKLDYNWYYYHEDKPR